MILLAMVDDLSANIKIERKRSTLSLGESNEGDIEPVFLLVARLQFLWGVERKVGKSHEHLSVPENSADELI